MHGEHVARHAVLEVRQELVQIQCHQMEELDVLDLQAKIVTLKHALVMRITIIMSVRGVDLSPPDNPIRSHNVGALTIPPPLPTKQGKNLKVEKDEDPTI